MKRAAARRQRAALFLGTGLKNGRAAVCWAPKCSRASNPDTTVAGRILVIRGGAIGDFILTLPALGLLREAFPESHIEILGYRHILALADGRHYANATRSIEYAKLAGFFNPKSDLDPELCEYFASFNQVISYIYDPDELFLTCLRRAGVKNFLQGSPKMAPDQHATYQLAQPLEKLALFLSDPAPRIFPIPTDHAEADGLVKHLPDRWLAIHPGSGGEKKNWPIEHWHQLIAHFLAVNTVEKIVLIGGESDVSRLDELRGYFQDHVYFLENVPLPVLGAALSRCALFIGHDSGISHLAAAAGASCLLLFGPTDPKVWAPANPDVHILQAPDSDLASLEFRDVAAKVEELLADA